MWDSSERLLVIMQKRYSSIEIGHIRGIAVLVLFAFACGIVSTSVRAQYTDDATLESDNPQTDQNFGHAVVAIDTVTESGTEVPILAVGAPWNSDDGRAYLVNGNDGTVRATLTSQNGNATGGGRFGAAVGRIGDVNGDDVADVIVGAPQEEPAGNDTGVAYIFDGKTGSFVRELQTPANSSNFESDRHFGAAVAGVGDVNNDGTPDAIVGAPRQAVSGTNRAGKAYLFSGANGSVIDVMTGAGEDPGLFGGAVAGVGDLVGNNVPDFVVGAYREDVGGVSSSGRVYLINGNDLTQTEITSPASESGWFGRSIASIGSGSDQDFVVGAVNEDEGGINNSGRAYVIDGANPTGTPVATLASGNPENGGHFGRSVVGMEDLSGDGTPDVLVGAPRETVNSTGDAGRAYMLDGATGSVLAPITSPSLEEARFGRAVAGSSQPVVGSPEEDIGGTLAAGRVYTFLPTIAFTDGRDGEGYDPPAPTPGSDENPVGRFKLSAAVTGTSLDEVTVSNNAATTASDVDAIELWASSDNTFDGTGTDTELVSTTYADNVTFSSYGGQPIPSGDVYLFVVMDLTSDASSDYEPYLVDETDISFSGGPLAEVNGTETSSFTNAYLSSSAIPLPVELTTLEATATGDGAVTVRWATASETNNAEFRVMRQATGEGGGAKGEWVQVGSRKGAGTTEQPQSYRFTDEELSYEADVLTYRLHQVDTDGTVHASDAVTVERGAPDQLELLGTYPNPARTQAAVRLAVPDEAAAEAATLRLYDVMGREVRTVEDVSGGRHTVSVDVSDLSSGVYVLRLSADGTTRTQRVTVVR